MNHSHRTLLVIALLAVTSYGLAAPEIKHGPATPSANKKAATGMSITGNLEMPTMVRTIPWQRPKREITPSLTPLVELLEPVDPVILKRKSELYRWLNEQPQ